jgi:S-formylglutathione hydrolase FrmB
MLVVWSCTATLAYGKVQISSRQSSVVTLELKSRLLERTVHYIAILPPNYQDAQSKGLRYPVLYLLHGLTGHYIDWQSKTKIAEYAVAYEVIIITPEGDDGWYTDSATVVNAKYESYIIEELIPDVDVRFRTMKERSGRAIAGLSMGGYGALKFGVKYPHKFAFAASLSGALEAASWRQSEIRMESIWRSLHSLFGPDASVTRTSNDLMKLVDELSADEVARLPYLYLDCGTEDPLFQTNRRFADLLTRKKVPHEFRQLPGGHTWSYWDQQVKEVLRVASRKMNWRALASKSLRSLVPHSKEGRIPVAQLCHSDSPRRWSDSR